MITLKSFLLNPSPELLGTIGFRFDEKDVDIKLSGKKIEIILPNFGVCDENRDYGFVIIMIIALVKYFYLKFDQQDDWRKYLDANKVFDPLIDALYNAAEHGNELNQEKKLILGIWFGEKGILYGIEDEGDFVRNHREQIEARTIFQSTRSKTAEHKGGGGMCAIYGADEIRVSGNTLYLVILTKSFLKKEVEN